MSRMGNDNESGVFEYEDEQEHEQDGQRRTCTQLNRYWRL